MEFELCAESLEACVAARDGGADRIELCSALREGGLTPSDGLLRAAVRVSRLPVFPILRPRGGDFVYSEVEFEVMVADLEHARAVGASGVVLGLLREDGRVDVERTRRLVELAGELEVTFHRAFDCVGDLSAALEDVIATGCTRVLTSGGKATADEGVEVIRGLVAQAGGRIRVMAGSGLRPGNAAEVARVSGATAFHASLREKVRSEYAGLPGAGDCWRYPVKVEDVRAMVAELGRVRGVSFYLGVDAGGTKTDYVLADETRELARVRTGTIRLIRTDAVTAAENLEHGLRELTAAGGVAMSEVSRTCVGTSGVTIPLVSGWMREAFGARVGGKLIVLGDVEIALDAAFPGRPGVLVIAGTGSNVAGRGEDGEIVTAGGWGPVLADQGSGNRIGVQALRAACLAVDEGVESELMGEILRFWGLGRVEELVAYANGVPSPDFSTLAGVVTECAERGDGKAREVLRKEGAGLGYLVRLVLRRVSTDGWVPGVAFTGSVVEKIALVREALVAEVRREFPGVEVVAGLVDPTAGAVWRARMG